MLNCAPGAEKKNGVESLVLTGRRNIVEARQVREELFELLFTGELLGHGPQRSDISTEPEYISLLGGKGFGLAPDDGAGSVDGLVCVHNGGSVTGVPGHRLFRSKRQ